MTDITPLLSALNSPTIKTRRDAAARLGRSGDPAAVDSLVQALADTHKAVRREAAQALGRLDDERAVPGLIAALADPDPGSPGRGDFCARAAEGPPGGHPPYRVPGRP